MLVDVLDPETETVDSKAAALGAQVLEKSAPGTTVIRAAGVDVPIPDAIVHLIAHMLEGAAAGRRILVSFPYDDDQVTTTEAASILGVSRPHVAKLVDLGLLPGIKVGSHRRIRVRDLLAYQEKKDRHNQVLDELTAETERLGLYDDEHVRKRKRA